MQLLGKTRSILTAAVVLTMVAIPSSMPELSEYFGTKCAAAEAATAGDTTRYQRWQTGLSRNVSSQGLVNYKQWKAERQDLDQFILSLKKIGPTEYDSMNRNEKIALWINAYNSFTVQLILDHYPIRRSGFNLYPESSIRQIDRVWEKYKISAAGRTVSLHEIENEILRKEFKEPLTHFAINCASRSCPPLSNKVYMGSTLPEQLEHAAAAFVKSSNFNRIDPPRKKVELSKIFDWYGEDFVPKYFTKPLARRSRSQAAVIMFVAERSDAAERAILQSNDFALSYLSYDWTLNEDRGER